MVEGGSQFDGCIATVLINPNAYLVSCIINTYALGDTALNWARPHAHTVAMSARAVHTLTLTDKNAASSGLIFSENTRNGNNLHPIPFKWTMDHICCPLSVGCGGGPLQILQKHSSVF